MNMLYLQIFTQQQTGETSQWGIQQSFSPQEAVSNNCGYLYKHSFCGLRDRDIQLQVVT